MLKCFDHLIGEVVEAYVDDIIVKTKHASQLVCNLERAFEWLRRHGVKLNPEKCVFGVPKGMLLGFIVSERGIEHNPEKITAIHRMGPIKNLKGVQHVTGCLAALSRFISRLDERVLPMYKLLKKSDHFAWTDEAQEALDKVKEVLANPPVLVAPTPGESLLLYLAATTPARLLSLSDPRRVTPWRSSDRCTSSVKCYPTPRPATFRSSRSCTE